MKHLSYKGTAPTRVDVKSIKAEQAEQAIKDSNRGALVAAVFVGILYLLGYLIN